MNEELIGGIKNALERGDSIDEAVQSFISAGYNPDEVRAAADTLSQGSLALTKVEKTNVFVVHPPIPPSEQASDSSKQPKPLPVTQPVTIPQEEKKKDTGKKILIIALVVLLLFIVGAIAFVLIFPDTVDKIISNVFG